MDTLVLFLTRSFTPRIGFALTRDAAARRGKRRPSTETSRVNKNKKSAWFRRALAFASQPMGQKKTKNGSACLFDVHAGLAVIAHGFPFSIQEIPTKMWNTCSPSQVSCAQPNCKPRNIEHRGRKGEKTETPDDAVITSRGGGDTNEIVTSNKKTTMQPRNSSHAEEQAQKNKTKQKQRANQRPNLPNSRSLPALFQIMLLYLCPTD